MPPHRLMTYVRHSDEAGERYWHLTFSLAFGILGYAIATATLNTAARYISLYVLFSLLKTVGIPDGSTSNF